MIQTCTISLLFVLCWLSISTTSAFSQTTKRSATPTERIRNCHVTAAGVTTTLKASSTSPTATTDDNQDDCSTVSQDRRKFFSTALMAVAASATVVPTAPAFAATDSNKYGNPSNKRVGGLANKIRSLVCNTMDEMQRDLMQERWDLVEQYPAQLRSYVPMLTAYTDSAFPSEAPSDWGVRVALRYEVGRYFGCLERLRSAVEKRNLNDAYIAYADMSLHLDRYLRVGGIYTFYDNVIDNERYFADYNDALVYADPVKDPPEVRDLVVLCKGPDKGKTGIVIGIYQDGSDTAAIKLDRYKGMREIRVVPIRWAAKRLGEQAPDDVFLIPRKGS